MYQSKSRFVLVFVSVLLVAVLATVTCATAQETTRTPLFQGKIENSPTVEAPAGEVSSSSVLTVGMQKMLFALTSATLLFLALLLILKKFSPRGVPELPREAFETLGKSTLAGRQQIYLLRCGEKLFLVSVSQNGLDRVGEIDDPVEVERITRRCRGEILGTTTPVGLTLGAEAVMPGQSGKEA